LSTILKINQSLRVTADVGNILWAVEKYFGKMANYVKGKESMFLDWMRCYHPTLYLYLVARAYGRSRQDIGLGGVVSVLPAIWI
jgi:hypothetical protein